METVQETRPEFDAELEQREGASVQAGCYLLELSPDWMVRRASENVHELLGESHVALIDEPLGRFVHAQALHDLRNLFSRLSGTLGIARAYGIRLADGGHAVDIAFQLSGGRVLLEAVRSRGNLGECFGSVGGLIDGLSGDSGQLLLDHGARRMRALTGYDRVSVTVGQRRAQSSRRAMQPTAEASGDLPMIVADAALPGVRCFPRDTHDSSVGDALLRSPRPSELRQLREAGSLSALCVPFDSDGVAGEFRCESREPRAPSFEVHAAAELFAQMFAMRLEIDRLKRG